MISLSRSTTNLSMRRVSLPLVLSGFFFSTPTIADGITATQAEQLVTAAPCLKGESIDATLQHKVSASMRDLGWQVFEEDGVYTVERALLVSKSMQLRYRWKVDKQGAIQPSGDRAEKLCVAEE